MTLSSLEIKKIYTLINVLGNNIAYGKNPSKARPLAAKHDSLHAVQ